LSEVALGSSHRYSWPCSPWSVGPARGPTTTGHGTAPGRAWAATVARGTAQARSDGPVLNDPVKNIAF